MEKETEMVFTPRPSRVNFYAKKKGYKFNLAGRLAGGIVTALTRGFINAFSEENRFINELND